MLVVLEGSEAVGKSTLAEELITHWDRVKLTTCGDVDRPLLLHTGPPDTSRPIFPQYAEPLQDERFRATVLDPRHLVILDRFHLGELIYGPLLRGKTALTTDRLAYLELTLKALGAFTLVVSATHDEIRERMGPHREDMVDADTAVQINGQYLRLASQLRWPVVHPSTYRPGELAADVLGKARVLTEGAKDLLNHPGYVGSPRPMILFAGDRPSGWTEGDGSRPAFYPGTVGGSASYLLRALESANANVAYGLCNVNDDTDVRKLHEALHWPSVVALGRHAQAKLSSLGFSYADVPHPQWVRRFMHHSLEEYGRDLFFGVESVRPTS
jgi:thymidylate kinase